jgi:uncharacterized protein YwqG
MTLPSALRDEVTAELAGTMAEPYLADILPLIRPAIRSDPVTSTTASPGIGSSKLRGQPDVPPHWEWPSHDSSRLRFLAQFRMADLCGYVGADSLPKAGVLSFFYGTCADPTPFYPSCKHELQVARVYHFDDSSLRPAALPDSASDQSTCWRLSFEQIWSMPDYPFHYASDSLYCGLSEEDEDSLIEVLVENGDASGPIKLLGYPDREQEGYLQLACECLTRAIPFNDSPSVELRDAAVEWDLLAQFGMYDDRVWPFGSDGYLCFWIRNSDLARCDFSQVCYTFERT